MTFRAAIIGLGVGEQHARTFAQHPDSEVTWLYDLEMAKAEYLAEELGQGIGRGSEQDSCQYLQ